MSAAGPGAGLTVRMVLLNPSAAGVSVRRVLLNPRVVVAVTGVSVRRMCEKGVAHTPELL